MLHYTVLAVFVEEEHGGTRELLEDTRTHYGISFVYAQEKEDMLAKLKEYPDAVLVVDGRDPPYHGFFYGADALNAVRASGYGGPLLFLTWASQYLVGVKNGADATLITGTTPCMLKTHLKDLIEERRVGERVRPETYHPRSFFIAHSSADHPFAEKLARALVSYGHRVWFDEWQIRVGDSLVGRIQAAVDHCDYLIVVLSPEALRSSWVQKEVGVKLTDELASTNTLVLPVLAKACKVPAFLRDKYYVSFEDDFNTALSLLLTRLPVIPRGMRDAAQER